MLEPVAKKAVDEAKKENALIVMCVDGFQTDEEALHLRDLLWYARDNNVDVTFVSKESK